MINNEDYRELSVEIFDTLKEKGCGIGNASIHIINNVIKDFNSSVKKHEVSDETLLEFYNKGFSDELKGESLILKAYLRGQLDAIAGDDVPSIDAQTEEDIIKKIRG